MMIKFSLLHVALICIPGALGTSVIKAENPTPDGALIVFFNTTTSVNGFGVQSDEDMMGMVHGIIDGTPALSSHSNGCNHGTVDTLFKHLNGCKVIVDDVGKQNLLNSESVAIVEEDGIIQLEQDATWGLDRIDDVNLPLDKTYNPTFGNHGEGVTAYIIDTGVLASHDEFGDRATQEYNSSGDGKNFDCNGHGTHVAGTVGSNKYGVANKSKLVGVKVLTCSGSGSYSGVISGIEWVRTNANKPATANMSLGGGKSTAVNLAVKKLVESGVTTVVAAGNSNANACNYSPASELSAITVGATDSRDNRSSFSNYGTCVDIFAPGTSITAPWIGNDSALRTISGTSMASPHVCGGVALYLGQNNRLSPNEVVTKMLEDSIPNTITNVGTGSPNKFLYVGAKNPTAPPAPTRVPTTAPTAPSSSFGPTPSSHGTGEPTGGDGTAEPTFAPTPSCEGKTKNQCKKVDSCVFSKQKKIFGDCVFKKKYKQDCDIISDEEECTSEGNCMWDGDGDGDGECLHRCDVPDENTCKTTKDGKKKMCKAKKVKNPCKGCHPKNQCA